MQQLQVTALAALVNAGATTLLDVREPWEVALARITLPDATVLNLPMHEVPAGLAHIPRTQPVVCICHHGARSAQVVSFLLQQGYVDVYNLAGGVDAWSVAVDPDVPRY